MLVTVENFPTALKVKAYEFFWEEYVKYQPLFEEIVDFDPNVDSGLIIENSAIDVDDLEEVPFGSDLPQGVVQQGRDVYIAVKQFSRQIPIAFHAAREFANEKILERFAKRFAVACVRTKEKKVATLFLKGALLSGHEIFNNSYETQADPSGNYIYDGKPFFAPDQDNYRHEDLVGNEYYNYSALALTSDNFKTVWEKMTSLNNKDELGHPFSLLPDVLLVPVANEPTAKEIILKNPVESYNPFYRAVDIVSWAYLTDSDCWILGCKKKGIKAIQLGDPVIDIVQNQNNKAYHIQAIMLFGVAVTNWRYWYGVNLPQSE